MIPDSKERWVIQQLKKRGYRDFNQFCDHEMLLWKPLENYQSFDWCDSFQFHISRQKGCWLHYRPRWRPQLHLTWHFSWPTMKAWAELEECGYGRIEIGDQPQMQCLRAARFVNGSKR